jgi:hypothetical protein
MNDDKLQQALKQTQAQAEEAASQLGGLLRKGAEKLKQAADAATEAIRNDIDNHPE